MNLLNAHLVDEIKKHTTGQVDLIGLYEDIYLEQVPATLENIQVFLDLGLEAIDKGKKHQIEMILLYHSENPENSESKSIGTEVGMPLKISFDVPTAADFSRNTAQLDLAFFDVTLPSYGRYTIEVNLDGVLQRRLPLFVLPKD
jgi:hypothetical protein